MHRGNKDVADAYGTMTWQEMVDSGFVFAPAPEECVAGMSPPVVPGPGGSYPVPIPGQHTWW